MIVSFSPPPLLVGIRQFILKQTGSVGQRDQVPLLVLPVYPSSEWSRPDRGDPCQASSQSTLSHCFHALVVFRYFLQERVILALKCGGWRRVCEVKPPSPLFPTRKTSRLLFISPGIEP